MKTNCVQLFFIDDLFKQEHLQIFIVSLKVKYHADGEYENPLKNSEKNSMCWSKVTLSNNGKKIISYHTSFFFFLNAI